MTDVLEIWHPVDGWPYEVSNIGRVRQISNGVRSKVLKPFKNNGYQAVSLARVVANGCTERSQFKVHRLVALAFIDPVPEGKECNHIDGNKWNPAASNLEYVTSSENTLHSIKNGRFPIGERRYNATLTEEKVKAIWTLYGFGFPRPAIKSLLGISESSVHHILGRRNWKHLAPPEEIAS